MKHSVFMHHNLIINQNISLQITLYTLIKRVYFSLILLSSKMLTKQICRTMHSFPFEITTIKSSNSYSTSPHLLYSSTIKKIKVWHLQFRELALVLHLKIQLLIINLIFLLILGALPNLTINLADLLTHLINFTEVY